MGENLKDILNLINKKYGKETIDYGSKIKDSDVERMSTGVFSLDVELGGGLPLGRIIELYGPEQSGKSTLSLKIIREFQRKNKTVAYIDAESTYDPAWAKRLGVDQSKLLLSRPDTGEKAADILDTLVRSGKIDLIILDSVAAIIPQMDLETSMLDSERVGGRAQLMNRIVRKLHSALNNIESGTKNNCTIVLINQIRMKIGVYGNPETTTGGQGIKYGASVRIELRNQGYIKSKNETIGRIVKFKIVKNKTYIPYKTGTYDFYLNGVISNRDSVIQYAILLGLIKQLSKRSYSYNGKKYTGIKKLNKALDKEKIKLLAKEVKKLSVIKGYDITQISNGKEEHKEEGK